MARPIAEHPAISITTAVGVLGAIAVGFWAGHELRKRRLADKPYEAYSHLEETTSASEDDFSGVGI
jgi:hypothetical protein